MNGVHQMFYDNGNANEISNLKIGRFLEKNKCGGFQQDSKFNRNLKQRRKKKNKKTAPY